MLIDFLIIGAGPAGLAAGIHAARNGLTHCVVDADKPGGLLRAASLVENLPGYPKGLSGQELADQMVEHALAAGVCIQRGKVESVKRKDGVFEARMAGMDTEIRARAVFLATGTQAVVPNLPGVDCARECGMLHGDARSLPRDLSGAKVLICGGGDGAFDAGVSVAKRGGKAEVFMRAESPVARRGLVDQAIRAGVLVNSGLSLAAFDQEGTHLSARFCDAQGQTHHRRADHVMICYGRIAQDEIWKGLSSGEILHPDCVETEQKSVYVGGDLIHARCRYVALALGDGTRAGWLAEQFIK